MDINRLNKRQTSPGLAMPVISLTRILKLQVKMWTENVSHKVG
jgi:hypothetical protein